VKRAEGNSGLVVRRHLTELPNGQRPAPNSTGSLTFVFSPSPFFDLFSLHHKHTSRKLMMRQRNVTSGQLSPDSKHDSQAAVQAAVQVPPLAGKLEDEHDHDHTIDEEKRRSRRPCHFMVV
jgi:hypothetical protein